MDFVRHWATQCELPVSRLVSWIGIGSSKYFDWARRYGLANEHNAAIPRDWWIEDWEREAIIAYHDAHPTEGYRRLAFMMIDEAVVAVSPSTVYRVLSTAGRMGKRSARTSSKGKGFAQPSKPHGHWHVDISHINLHGTFYYLCSVLDGYSRVIVHWELRESMKEADVETILLRAKESVPGVSPRVISDNGPQFIAKDFKEFIRVSGMTHVRTSPYYPQSNGKIERWHKSLKTECIRPMTPLTVDDARRVVGRYVEYYNNVRLHSAIGYVTPADRMSGKDTEVLAERDRRLESARAVRAQNRRETREQVCA